MISVCLSISSILLTLSKIRRVIALVKAAFGIRPTNGNTLRLLLFLFLLLGLYLYSSIWLSSASYHCSIIDVVNAVLEFSRYSSLGKYLWNLVSHILRSFFLAALPNTFECSFFLPGICISHFFILFSRFDFVFF